MYQSVLLFRSVAQYIDNYKKQIKITPKQQKNSNKILTNNWDLEKTSII